MEQEYAAAYARLYNEHWWWRARQRILVGKIRRILSTRQSTVRILDVGCGAGLFFDELETFGHVEGIEADPLAVEQSGMWRSRIHLGELDSFRSDAPFDLILMLDVLEHVANPGDLLRQATLHLASDGRVLMTVPAFDWLWTSHDDLNHHHKRYTAGELSCVIGDAGLTPVETGYLFQSLIVPKLLIRTKEALASQSAEIPRIPPPAVNRFLRAWCAWEYAALGWLPFGSSALAVAQRPPS